jgi:hypothetical protein
VISCSQYVACDALDECTSRDSWFADDPVIKYVHKAVVKQLAPHTTQTSAVVRGMCECVLHAVGKHEPSSATTMQTLSRVTAEKSFKKSTKRRAA